MLDPTSLPEDHRGGSLAGGRPGAPRGAVRRRRRRREGHRLRRRGHRRVRARPRRRVLLPRGEHPPPGRAPGHRARHRAGSRRAAARASLGANALDLAPELRGHAVEARLYAEDVAAGFRAVERSDRAPDDPCPRGSAGRRRRTRTARPSRPSTTPCWRRSSPTATPEPTRSTDSPRPSTRRGSRRDHQPRPARRRAPPPRVPRRCHRHGLPRPSRSVDPRRVGGRTRRPSCPSHAVAAALAAQAGRRAAAPVQATLPSGWRNVLTTAQLASFTSTIGPIDIGYDFDPLGPPRDGQRRRPRRRTPLACRRHLGRV